ncbi:MAG: TRAP transporter large permease [Desulfobacteraceae bacterium]|nr:MAG: TRAP transporter large permease [Desulfobacteraceae bacterium]
MTELQTGLVAVLVLIGLFLSNMELYLCMLIVGFFGFAGLTSFEAALSLLASDFYSVFVSYSFSVIPLFILMGQLAFNSGIATQLYNATYRFVGHIPGGIGVATIIGATLFKTVCGSGAATTATFASVAIPEMDKVQYSRKLSTGLVSSVGTLGNLIPPSLVLVIFGIIGEQSIGKLFLGGIIPGLMLSLFLTLVVFGWCRINPSIGPRGERSTWKERRRALLPVLWPALIFLVIMGAMVNGTFSPTQAGAVGAAAVLIWVVAIGKIKFRGIVHSTKESLSTATMILVLVYGSTLLGHYITLLNIPQAIAGAITNLPLSRVFIMILIGAIFLIGGSIIDDMAFAILAIPVFMPTALKLGYDPIWFLIYLAITIGIGVLIPPVAVGVFIVKNMTKEPLGLIYRGVAPFLIALIFCGVLIFIFPQLVTWLAYSGA